MFKKIAFLLIGLVVLVTLSGLLVVLAGAYKFNYLASKPGYDADGNKIEAVD